MIDKGGLTPLLIDLVDDLDIDSGQGRPTGLRLPIVPMTQNHDLESVFRETLLLATTALLERLYSSMIQLVRKKRYAMIIITYVCQSTSGSSQDARNATRYRGGTITTVQSISEGDKYR
jgi:hypothetical protein